MSYINDGPAPPTYDTRGGIPFGSVGASIGSRETEPPATVEVAQAMEKAAELSIRLMKIVERITGLPILDGSKVEPSPPQMPGLLNHHRQAARSLNRLTSQAHDALSLLEQQIGL